MSELLTVKLSTKAASRLRRIAARGGESLEALVQRLLEELTNEQGEARLSDAQVDDLRKRVKRPGPFATPREVAAVLAKFK